MTSALNKLLEKFKRNGCCVVTVKCRDAIYLRGSEFELYYHADVDVDPDATSAKESKLISGIPTPKDLYAIMRKELKELKRLRKEAGLCEV